MSQQVQWWTMVDATVCPRNRWNCWNHEMIFASNAVAVGRVRQVRMPSEATFLVTFFACESPARILAEQWKGKVRAPYLRVRQDSRPPSANGAENRCT